MLPDRIALLLEKYHSGKCTEDEQTELFNWYDSSAGLEEELEKKLNESPELSNRIHDDLFVKITKPLNPSIKKIWFKVSYAAASVLLVLGLTWWIYTKDNSITIVSYHQTERILLPDSSVVWLKPNSKLEYGTDLAKNTIRKVTFEGEAFFQIHHDPEKPFEVYTKDLKVKVLGTSFNLRSLPEDSLAETMLVSGKVQLESLKEEQKIALVPNQRAVYSVNTKKINVDIPKKSTYQETRAEIQSKKLNMVFENKPVSELLSAIESKFGMQIHFSKEDVKTCRITVDLEKESLEDIMNLLQITQGISYSIYKNEIFINGNMCNP